jgi:Spondin_N
MKKTVSRLILVSIVVVGAFAASAQNSAQYTVKFTRVWSENTHPFEYPEAGVLTGPHFSGLIGASHNGAWSLYKEGAKPTKGLEKLAEEGKHSPFDDEINAAIGAGKAGALFETGPIRDTNGSETTEVTLTNKFPMISAVAMIAPSPDWFAGAANINLMENGKWVATKTVDLYAYDAGSDDGTTYKADDKDVTPKKPVMSASSKHFVNGGKKVRVATLTFTKK